MVSWDRNPHTYEPDRHVREQDELARQEWDRRLQYGDQSVRGHLGFSFTEWPDCGQHGYVAVDGLCGVCVLEGKRRGRRAA